jgi:hypothetical protein
MKETTFVILAFIIILVLSIFLYIIAKIRQHLVIKKSNLNQSQNNPQLSQNNPQLSQNNPQQQTQIIRVNIPIGGVGDGLSHVFTFITGKTPSGFLIEVPPASPVPLGMIVVNYTGNIIGYIVPVVYQSHRQLPNPVLILDPAVIGPNSFSCNQPYACGAVNLTTVLTADQAAMIGSYTGTLPTYSNGTPLSNSPTMNSFGSTATTLSF